MKIFIVAIIILILIIAIRISSTRMEKSILEKHNTTASSLEDDEKNKYIQKSFETNNLSQREKQGVRDESMHTSVVETTYPFDRAQNVNISGNNEESDLNGEIIRIAKAELDRLKVPYSGREIKITKESKTSTVEFLPPAGILAGSFIVKVDLSNKIVIDVKVYR